MNFLSRKLEPEDSTEKRQTPVVVHRETEITVERTWTRVSARARTAEKVSAAGSLPPRDEPVL
jgi:uncharacterized protein YifE (UPF0438 family)